ncbi:MAG: hypothetical protein II863_19430 [Kiritimatiellae bacterium]|nr:hypothetical protein [Kiritimatiellia bacterium]
MIVNVSLGPNTCLTLFKGQSASATTVTLTEVRDAVSTTVRPVMFSVKVAVAVMSPSPALAARPSYATPKVNVSPAGTVAPVGRAPPTHASRPPSESVTARVPPKLPPTTLPPRVAVVERRATTSPGAFV